MKPRLLRPAHAPLRPQRVLPCQLPQLRLQPLLHLKRLRLQQSAVLHTAPMRLPAQEHACQAEHVPVGECIVCGSAGGSLSSPAALLPWTKPAACTSASLVCKSTCAAFLASAYPALAAYEATDTAAAACAAHLAAACSSARPGLQKL